jgi:nucleotide-binding universal stress UspA family protein
MFASILVGTDGSPTAHTAVAYAIDLARQLGARLLIVSAYEPLPGPLHTPERLPPGRAGAGGEERWLLGRREDVLAMLRESEQDARAVGVQEVETFARQGDAADAILDVAEEQRCDLIVVGNKGMAGVKRFLLGSVPNKVSHHAPCSVLIVRTT